MAFSLAAVARLFGVRRRELPRIIPLTSAYGLVLASLYTLKPARNALFLDGIGIEQLPYVLMLVALIGGGAALLFTRFTAAVRLDRLILATFLVSICFLIGFRFLLPLGFSWSYYLFYIWVNLFSLMSTSLIWLLANAVFNPREGRRLFGVIGTAGIVGAFAGAAFTSWVATRVGTENLLLLCGLMIGLALFILYPVRAAQASSAPMQRHAEAGGVLAALRQSALIRMLGGMAALVAIVAAIIDVQFNQIVDESFSDTEQKTAFFGQVLALLSALALLFQLFAAPRILRSLGVVSALLFLPVSMALGSVAVLLAPVLASGILLKIGDGSFRHAIHKSATEILYLPIPSEIKRRTKVVLDTTVDNLGTGVGALLVLVALKFFGFSYQHLSFLSLSFIGLWLILIARSRNAYVDTFRAALQRREIDPAELNIDITESATIDGLIKNLAAVRPTRGPMPVKGTTRAQERRIAYSLDMLAPVRTTRLVEPVAKLLSHPSAVIRRKALLVLRTQQAVLPLDAVEELQRDDDLEVRIEALNVMCSHGEGERFERVRQAVSSPDDRMRGAAVGFIASYGTDEEHDLIDEEVIRRLFADTQEDAPGMVEVARILGELPETAQRPALREAMRQLMDHPEPDVVMQTIESVGKLGDEEFVPWLLEKLDDRSYRAAARAALAAYGPPILRLLEAHIANQGAPVPSRSRAIRVMADVVDQKTVDLLQQRLTRANSSLQYLLLKSLSKLRNKSTDLQFDAELVDAELRKASRSLYETIQMLNMPELGGDGDRFRLLMRALREKEEQTLERMFRLLGLSYPPRDMYNAYLGMVSGDRTTRASALEFLDNMLDREMKDLLLPLLEQASTEAAIAHGQRVFGEKLANCEVALETLLSGNDPWLRACAVYRLGGAPDLASRVDRVRSMEADEDALVRETAAMVVRSGNL